MKAILYTAAAIMLSLTAAAAETCEGQGMVWSGKQGKNEVRLYTPPSSPAGTYIFEGMTGGKPSWRVEADYACSNGDVICSLSIPLLGERSSLDVDEESIYEGGSPKYLIFANLSQHVAYAQRSGGAVQIKRYDKKASGETVALPNSYAFKGCGSPPERRAFSATTTFSKSNPFDGLWRHPESSCEFADADNGPAMRIKGRDLGMLESGCRIGKVRHGKSSTKADMVCQGYDMEWKETIERIHRTGEIRKGNAEDGIYPFVLCDKDNGSAFQR
ncbi:hypothetical protein [Aureimonas sp. SK2]|uniref:hypothetical protein n=1 Tax=Aureimonas sp. SK2 TaxID=3015992 RepID=UPI00244466BA|nr:hypothetical protein [Aureimonas sp. SK2]